MMKHSRLDGCRRWIREGFDNCSHPTEWDYDYIHSCSVCFDFVRTGTFFFSASLHIFSRVFLYIHMDVCFSFLTPYTFESTLGRARYVTEDCCTPSQLFCSEVHYLSLSIILLYYSPDRTFMSFCQQFSVLVPATNNLVMSISVRDELFLVMFPKVYVTLLCSGQQSWGVKRSQVRQINAKGQVMNRSRRMLTLRLCKILYCLQSEIEAKQNKEARACVADKGQKNKEHANCWKRG